MIQDIETIECVQIPKITKINTDLLYKNIESRQHSSICLDTTKLLSKDKNGFDFLNLNLHKTDLRNKNLNSIKLNFISKKINNESIVSQDYIDSNLININYNLMCGYNVIFDDKFHQNEDLLTPELILPIKYIKEHHSICVNIINIVDILPILNDLELHISFTEVEFEKEFDGLMSKFQIDQLIRTKNNTFNIFRVISGMGAKAFSEDLPKDKFNEFSPKIGNTVLVE